jgi:hypothetical protein
VGAPHSLRNCRAGYWTTIRTSSCRRARCLCSGIVAARVVVGRGVYLPVCFVSGEGEEGEGEGEGEGEELTMAAIWVDGVGVRLLGKYFEAMAGMDKL